MITRLAHACIFSADLDRTLKFYNSVLGFPLKFRFVKEGRLIGYYLEAAPKQFIEVFHRSEAAGGPAAIGHLCFEVDDIATIRAKLLENGCEATEAKLGADQSWQIWSKDPDGIPLEFHQYTPKSSQFTGADCEVDW